MQDTFESWHICLSRSQRVGSHNLLLFLVTCGLKPLVLGNILDFYFTPHLALRFIMVTFFILRVCKKFYAVNLCL